MMRLALGLVAILAVSCGGSEEQAQTISPTTVEGSTTTTEPEQEVGDLQQKLLTVADLPTGYSLEPPEDEEEDEGPSEFCEGASLELAEEFGATQEAEVSFAKGEASLAGAAFLGQTLGEYSDDNADRAFDHAVEVFQGCQEFETTQEDGTTFKGTLSPLSFSKFGDETFAIHLSGELEGEGMTFPIGGDVVFAREGRVICLLVSFGFGASQIPATELEDIVEIAMAKL